MLLIMGAYAVTMWVRYGEWSGLATKSRYTDISHGMAPELSSKIPSRSVIFKAVWQVLDGL